MILGCLPDVRQAIRRLDDLTRPAVRHFDVRDDRLERLREPVVARARIGRLSGFVILAAEDYQVVLAVRVDPKVMIRIRSIPEDVLVSGEVSENFLRVRGQ